MDFELVDHTADVAVAARGASLGEVFVGVADGLASAMCERWPNVGDRFELRIRSESKEALLFDYLDELIYQRDVREVLPVDHEVDIDATSDGWDLRASARGIPLVEIDAREVKAVTYSDMRLEETSNGWEGYVVFDV